MLPEESLLVTLVELVDRIPTPQPSAKRSRGKPRAYSEKLFLKALVIMILKHLSKVHELLSVLEQPTAEMRVLRLLLTEDYKYPSRRTWERRLKGFTHYSAPDVREECERDGRILVASRHGKRPHTDSGVEVRRVLHELRSRAIENFSEQFKGIFDGHAQVPTRGLRNTARWALGAVFVYQLALLSRHEHEQPLRVGLKAFLKAA